MGLVRDAVVSHVIISNRESKERWKEAHEDRPDRLFVSDLGSCVRKAYLRLRGWEETHPLDPYVLEVMRAGKVWEWETTQAMMRAYPNELQTQVSVGNNIWSGRADYLLPGRVIEHKATNPANFKYGDRLPYPQHCLQVLAYGVLRGGCAASIYYRGWDQWAEIEVFQTKHGVAWERELNGRFRSGIIEGLDIVEEMAEFEKWWERQELPPRYGTPFQERFACTKKDGSLFRPVCQFFGVCWPRCPQGGAFKEEEWKSES